MSHFFFPPEGHFKIILRKKNEIKNLVSRASSGNCPVCSPKMQSQDSVKITQLPNHFKAKWGWINATTIGVNCSNQTLHYRACKQCFVFSANHLNNTIASHINLDNPFQGKRIQQIQANRKVLALSLTESPGRTKTQF